MSNLRERVAEAMWMADPDPYDPADRRPFSEADWEARRNYLAEADAAIALVLEEAAKVADDLVLAHPGRAAGDRDAALDLIEVKPRIKREVWVNVYEGVDCWAMHTCKEDADRGAMRSRLACVKLTIDCEEGEGL